MLDNFTRAFRTVFVCVIFMACFGLVFDTLFSILCGTNAHDDESCISGTTASTRLRYDVADISKIQVDVTEVRISKFYAEPPRKPSTTIPLSYALDHGNGQTYNSRRVSILPVQQ